MNVLSQENPDESLECSAGGYVMKTVSSGRYRRRLCVRGITPVVINRAQKLACGVIVKPPPTFVNDEERRIRLWGAFHEPMDDQPFELVGILTAPAVRSLSDLNLLDQTSIKPKEMSTYLSEDILEIRVRNISDGGNPS